ncbi:MAG: spore coat protein, partial [Carboxydocellales bacterium]
MDQISEKDLMTDLMQTQRFITSSYNGKASESTSWALKEQMLRILEDEQLSLSLINQAMEQRGWSQAPPAKQQDIQEALTKFNDPQMITAMEQLLQPQYQITKEATTMYGQNYPTQSLNDFRQSSGSYGSNQQGYAGGGIGGAQGYGTTAQGYGGTGFGTQAAMGQPTGYQGMGPTAGYQGPANQGFGYGNQAGLGYQGTGWGQQMGMGGIMNSAAQNLQSNFPGLFSGVMGNWVQTRPDVYGQGGYANPQFGGQYQQTGFQGQQPYSGFQGQPQYMPQNQYPQTSYQGQNVLNNFQQTRGDYGMGSRGLSGGAGYGTGLAGGQGQAGQGFT